MWRGGVSEYLCEYCVLYVKQFLCGVLFSHDEQFLHSKTQLECVAREQIEKNTKKNLNEIERDPKIHPSTETSESALNATE